MSEIWDWYHVRLAGYPHDCWYTGCVEEPPDELELEDRALGGWTRRAGPCCRPSRPGSGPDSPRESDRRSSRGTASTTLAPSTASWTRFDIGSGRRS
jgi:hypothetical protein